MLFADAWEQPRRPSLRITVQILGLLNLCPLSLLFLMTAVGSDLSGLGNDQISGESMLAGCSLITLLMGIVFGVAQHREMEYRREWEELEIDSELAPGP